MMVVYKCRCMQLGTRFGDGCVQCRCVELAMGHHTFQGSDLLKLPPECGVLIFGP